MTIHRQLEISHGGITWTVHAERALQLDRSLYITDPHFGKEQTFQRAGLPVPMGSLTEDLERLSRLVTDAGADRLVILGDFYHARSSQGGAANLALLEWRRTHPDLEILLLRGNHDRHAGDPPAELRVDVVNGPYVDGNVRLVHGDRAEEMLCPNGGMTLCGHLHPAACLQDRAGRTLRLPCFHFSRHTIQLPAFGQFVGTAAVRPRAGDQVVVVREQQVVALDVPKATAT